MTRLESYEITKEEYEMDDENWLEILGQRYGFNSVGAVDAQRNFDGKKYTVDLWFEE